MAENVSLSAIQSFPDHEVSGRLNRALGEGAKFSLMLAMLENDILHRPHLNKSAEHDRNEPPDLRWLQCYRQAPLKSSQRDFEHIAQTARLVQTSAADALLWQCLHPHPLSVHNDPAYIDETIVANCSYYTQKRLSETDSAKDNTLQVDETRLYDILEGMTV